MHINKIIYVKLYYNVKFACMPIHLFSTMCFPAGRESKPGGRERRAAAVPGRPKQARRCDPDPRAEWCQREPDSRRVRLVVK